MKIKKVDYESTKKDAINDNWDDTFNNKKMKKRNVLIVTKSGEKLMIPNMLSFARIILSIYLLWIPIQSESFVLIYIICGITDILDGHIARSRNMVTKFGGVLDSIADMVFVIVALIIFLPIIYVPRFIIIWVTCIACIRILSPMVSFLKYGTFAFLHTYANKATGAILFFLPILYWSFKDIVIIIIACIISSISSIEELIIQITSKKFNQDIHSYFTKKHTDRSYRNTLK